MHTRTFQRRVDGILCCLLAVLAGLWSLRNATSESPVTADAARHMMNGAMILDFAVSGQYTSPRQFAEDYYSRLPAVTLPFHPPGFPLMEAVMFAVLGVSALTARITVAFCCAATAVLLYRLVLATHQSRTQSIAACLLTFAPHLSQFVATDVLLEFPALMFTVAAAFQLRTMDSRFTTRSAVLFGLFAACAIWTKQNTVFLGAVPFMVLLLSRQWGVLRRPPIWIAMSIFALASAGLVLWSLPVLDSVLRHSVSWTANLGDLLVRNAEFYGGTFAGLFGILKLLTLAGAAFLLISNRRPAKKRNGFVSLYLSWCIAATAVPLLSAYSDGRYLFFAFPAFAVLVVTAGGALLQKMLPDPAVGTIIVVSAGLMFIVCWRHPQHLGGPRQAAERVHRIDARRVLVCATTDGAFVAAMRSLNATWTDCPFIIRGDKLRRSSFRKSEFESMASEFGIDAIVLESSTGAQGPWHKLCRSPTKSMMLITRIPEESTFPPQNGELLVFSFAKTSRNPKHRLKIPISRTGKNLELRLSP